MTDKIKVLGAGVTFVILDEIGDIDPDLFEIQAEAHHIKPILPTFEIHEPVREGNWRHLNRPDNSHPRSYRRSG